MAGGGRKRKTTEAEDEALVNIVRNQPFTNSIKAKEESNFPASKWVARRRIKEAGLRNSVAAQKVFLTEELPSVNQRFPDDEFIFQQVEQCITV